MFNRLKSGGKAGLQKGLDMIKPYTRGPIATIKESVRESVLSLIGKMRIGFAKVDRAASGVVKGVARTLTPELTTLTNQKLQWAQGEAPYTEDKKAPNIGEKRLLGDTFRSWGMALYQWGENLNRFAPEFGTDADVISREEFEDQQYADEIEQEEGIEVIPQQESDRLILKQIQHYMDGQQALPIVTFPANHRLSQMAQQRASYICRIPNAQPAPLNQRYYKPLKRKNEKKPFEDLSYEDHERVTGGEELKDGGYVYDVPEDDVSLAERSRKRQKNADTFYHSEISMVFDLEANTYPDNGLFQTALEQLYKNPAYKARLTADNVRVAFGFCRKGSKAVLTCFLVEDESTRVESRPMLTDDSINTNDQWWLEQIPASERADDSLWPQLLTGLGGYSMYMLYQFSRQIKALRNNGEGKEVSFPEDISAFVFKKEKNLLGSSLQTMQFSIMVNGKPEPMKMIKGKDVIVLPTGSSFSTGDAISSPKKSEENSPKAELISFADYLEKLEEKLEYIQRDAKGKEVAAKKLTPQERKQAENESQEQQERDASEAEEAQEAETL